MSAANRVLGVDFGTVRVGLAVSDPDRKIAFPLTTYTRRTSAKDAEFFQQLVAGEGIALFVVGLPIRLDGTEGPKAAEARAFGLWLQEATRQAVVFWDERFTTAEADDALRLARLKPEERKARRDRVAAQIILQSFLDAREPPQQTS